MGTGYSNPRVIFNHHHVDTNKDGFTQTTEQLQNPLKMKTKRICEYCGKYDRTGTLRKIDATLISICEDCIDGYLKRSLLKPDSIKAVNIEKIHVD